MTLSTLPFSFFCSFLSFPSHVSFPSNRQSLFSMGRKTKSFKDEFSFEERLRESSDIISRYPDRLPVVVEKYTKCNLPDLEKSKYLIPRDMTIGQFIHILSKRLHMDPGQALFIFVRNTLPQTGAMIDSVYTSFKDEDGFLYLCYSSEKTFG